MRIPSKYYGGIFLLSFSSLLYELSLTRVFSVTLWYHFGFLIISTALMGFGVSGVVVTLWKKLRLDYDIDKTMGWLSICLSLSIVVCFALIRVIPFDPFNLYADKRQLIYMPLTYMLVSVPFFFTGLALSVLFSRYATHIHQLYTFDLIGAACGCIAIVVTISFFGGGGSVILAAAFAACAALIFCFRNYGYISTLATGLIVVSFFLAIRSDKLMPLHITSNKGRFSTSVPKVSRWNIFSKIDLYVDSSEWAPEKKSPLFIIDQGTAATGLEFDLLPDVRTALKNFPGDSLYGSCLAYLGKTKPRLLVIGSGCGTQVLDALHYGVSRVVAVEINPIINDVVMHDSLWGNLYQQPEVEPVTSEARSYIRSTKEKFDAIISVHTISNAAVASGALSLAENYVLTKEAFEDYYDHLRDDGIIYFTRPEFQLPRLFATGKEVLLDNGVKDPSQHFFAFTYPVPPRFKERKSFFSIFMMSKTPFTAQQIVNAKKYISEVKDNIPIILYSPGQKNQNIFDSLLTSNNMEQFYRQYAFEIEPATDNKPFFNHHARWSSLNWATFKDIFSQQRMARMALEDKPVAEVSLIVLLAQVIILSAIFILYPLWRFSSAGIREKNVTSSLLYFSGLGFGFIMIEIVLIQQFSLLLGDPVYAFALVLAALLLFTGVGSYISGKFLANPKRLISATIPALAVLLLLASFILPSILRSFVAVSMTARIILSVILIVPFGVLLGMPFPSGIQIISKNSSDLVPWAWGVNGFFTVIGSVATLILSMMIGFQAVLWIAAIVYLLSLVAIRKSL